MIIQKALNIKPIENRQDNQKNENDKEPDAKDEEESDPQTQNKEKLQLDATFADAPIKFSTDLNLLNQSRKKAETIINQLCNAMPDLSKLTGQINNFNCINY